MAASYCLFKMVVSSELELEPLELAERSLTWFFRRIFSFMSWALALRSLTMPSKRRLMRFSSSSHWAWGAWGWPNKSSECNRIPRFQFFHDTGNLLGEFLVGQSTFFVEKLHPVGKAPKTGGQVGAAV